MSILTSVDRDVFIVMPNEQFDTVTAPDVENLIVKAIEDGASRVLMDFSKTEFISSAGLRVIIKSAKLLKPVGGQVALCSASEQIHEVLEISGLVGVIDMFDDADAAVSKMIA